MHLSDMVKWRAVGDDGWALYHHCERVAWDYVGHGVVWCVFLVVWDVA